MTIDPDTFILAVAKVAVKLVSAKPDEAVEGLIDAFGVKLAEDKPCRQAARLFGRAIAAAIPTLLRATVNRLRTARGDDHCLRQALDASAKRLVSTLSAKDKPELVDLSPDAFSHPNRLPRLEACVQRLEAWLAIAGCDEKEARTVARRFPRRYVSELVAELRRNLDEYDALFQFTATPLTQAWRQEQAWRRYADQFAARRDQPAFLLDIPLHRVFVWPNAYHISQRRGERASPANTSDHPHPPAEVRNVVPLRAALDAWWEGVGSHPVGQRREFLMLSGDPGAGKSTVAREYVYHRASEHSDLALYCPLHKLANFRWGGFEDELQRYFRNEVGDEIDPVSAASGVRPLLLVLDGLDELTTHGEYGKKTADQFVEEIITTVLGWNAVEVRVAVLFCGRPIPVADACHRLRHEGQVLHLLPYAVPKEEAIPDRFDLSRVHYSDPDRLLGRHVERTKQLEPEILAAFGRSLPPGTVLPTEAVERVWEMADLRVQWWRQFGEATGGPSLMPDSFTERDVLEVTAQPLMHHLAAVVSLDPTTSSHLFRDGRFLRPALFRHILERVYHREWGDTGGHPSTPSGLTFDQFRRLFTVLGQASWHGGTGRVTTMTTFRDLCRVARIDRLLTKYEGQLTSGTTSLLTAFYLRYADVPAAEETFEFTHKSFAEHLAASRLVDVAEGFASRYDHPQQAGEEYGPRWSAQDFLEEWLVAAGPAPLTAELYQHVREEMEYREGVAPGTGGRIRDTLVALLNAAIGGGMPAHKLGGMSFGQMTRQAAHAEHALVCMIGACTLAIRATEGRVPPPQYHGWQVGTDKQIEAEETHKTWATEQKWLVKIRWPSDTAAAELIRRIRKPSGRRGARLEPLPMVDWDLSGQYLEGCDLSSADLSGANLCEASLMGATVRDALLTEANLAGAGMFGAFCFRADLVGANLTGAGLGHVVFSESCLHDAVLSGADLDGMCLSETHYGGASCDGVELDSSAGRKLLASKGVLFR